MAQITHEPDRNGVIRQIVSAATLREVLDAEGSDYDRPEDFGPGDEWDVDADKASKGNEGGR